MSTRLLHTLQHTYNQTTVSEFRSGMSESGKRKAEQGQTGAAERRIWSGTVSKEEGGGSRSGRLAI